MEESTISIGSGLSVSGEVANMEPTGKIRIKNLQCKDRKDRSGKSMIEMTCMAIDEFFTIGL